MTTVDCNIAVIKKSVKGFGLVTVEKSIEKDVASRKKRKDGVLEDSAASELVLSEKAVGGSWESEASNTTESDSINMEKECLVEKTSVDYSKKNLFVESDSN
ncbi:hypothetical protein G9A89_014637 [Geosiphon pyriformis]|nr:hypothetical protein G9A89_014637 [Geosiphon pyriformis]